MSLTVEITLQTIIKLWTTFFYNDTYLIHHGNHRIIVFPFEGIDLPMYDTVKWMIRSGINEYSRFKGIKEFGI
jgi:hypothetical protein